MRLADTSLAPMDLAAIHAVLLHQRFPALRRGLFALIAVFGTLIYGASLASLVHLSSFALQLTAVTGLSWIAFGLVISRWSGLPLLRCADHCLAAMVVGEAVLLLAALVNTVCAPWLADQPGLTWMLNGGFVLCSDLVMGAFLAHGFAQDRFAPGKTWLLWALLLNGTALLLTLTLYLLKP